MGKAHTADFVIVITARGQNAWENVGHSGNMFLPCFVCVKNIGYCVVAINQRVCIYTTVCGWVVKMAGEMLGEHGYDTSVNSAGSLLMLWDDLYLYLFKRLCFDVNHFDNNSMTFREKGNRFCNEL